MPHASLVAILLSCLCLCLPAADGGRRLPPEHPERDYQYPSYAGRADLATARTLTQYAPVTRKPDWDLGQYLAHIGQTWKVKVVVDPAIARLKQKGTISIMENGKEVGITVSSSGYAALTNAIESVKDRLTWEITGGRVVVRQLAAEEEYRPVTLFHHSQVYADWQRWAGSSAAQKKLTAQALAKMEPVTMSFQVGGDPKDAKAQGEANETLVLKEPADIEVATRLLVPTEWRIGDWRSKRIAALVSTTLEIPIDIDPSLPDPVVDTPNGIMQVWGYGQLNRICNQMQIRGTPATWEISKGRVQIIPLPTGKRFPGISLLPPEKGDNG